MSEVGGGVRSSDAGGGVGCKEGSTTTKTMAPMRATRGVEAVLE